MFNEFLVSGTIIDIDSDFLLLGYGKRTSMSKAPQKTPFFFMPDFFLTDPKPYCVHEKTLLISKVEFFKFLNTYTTQEMPKLAWSHEYTDFFKQQYDDLQRQIQMGEMIKGVPYVLSNSGGPFNKSLLIHCLKNIVHFCLTNPAYLYGFWDSCNGMLGASPEILFDIDYHPKPTLKTIACAGTVSDDSQLIEDLLLDPKLLHEHQIVVDGIVQALMPISTVTELPLQKKKVGSLNHLVTPIRAELYQEIDFSSLVCLLHPTPALGAYPKHTGAAWLRKYQKISDRKRFGAPFAYHCPKSNKTHCIVAIRNIQWDMNAIQIGAGCGVVQGSHYSMEKQEIQWKLQAVKDMFKI